MPLEQESLIVIVILICMFVGWGMLLGCWLPSYFKIQKEKNRGVRLK